MSATTGQPEPGWTSTVLIAVSLIAGFVAGLIVLPLIWALVLGGLLGIAGVVLLRRPAWRTGSLLVASVLLAFSGAEAMFGVLAPPPVNRDVRKANTPSDWTVSDPSMGYRPRPGTTVDVVATYGDELVYRRTYTIDATGARLTPGSRDSGPTYLFIGDSYMFGEGLADNETLPSRFATRLRAGAHVVNLGVLGHSPGHLVRAMETGVYDRYVAGKVAAVVTWISPLQLPRLTGDGGWLGTSPRYTLDAACAGGLRHTGTFHAHRLTDPLAGLSYLGRTYLASYARAANAGLERERAALSIALMTRLRDLARERYNAPVVVVYDWLDREEEGHNDLVYVPTLRAISRLGMEMISVRKITGQGPGRADYVIPRDGHPNARLADLLADQLARLLDR